MKKDENKKNGFWQTFAIICIAVVLAFVVVVAINA